MNLSLGMQQETFLQNLKVCAYYMQQYNKSVQLSLTYKTL